MPEHPTLELKPLILMTGAAQILLNTSLKAYKHELDARSVAFTTSVGWSLGSNNMLLDTRRLILSLTQQRQDSYRSTSLAKSLELEPVPSWSQGFGRSHTLQVGFEGARVRRFSSMSIFSEKGDFFVNIFRRVRFGFC